MATAWYSRHDYDVDLYEKNNYAGGHTNTVHVKENSQKIPVDTGFMVYNEKTYPNLVRLFNELKVESMDTSMSFGLQNRIHNLEFSCTNLRTFFAQRKNLVDPRHWLLLREIIRYFKVANESLQTTQPSSLTIGEFLKQNRFSPSLANKFVLPMAAAIWSTPPEGIFDYPASTLLRFMKNHHLLGIGIQLQWKTVKGGSDSYKKRILEPLKDRIELDSPVTSVAREGDQAIVRIENGQCKPYDAVVIASHADQTLAMLDRPTAQEARLLGSFKYNKNPVKLHSDESVMPRERRAWASWNFRYDHSTNTHPKASTHYWMNNLQKVSEQKNYFVSVDYDEKVDAEKIHWEFEYEHPRFDQAAINAQKSLPKLNEEGPIFFCGSYFRYGFHEDALSSALEVVRKLVGLRRTPNELATV